MPGVLQTIQQAWADIHSQSVESNSRLAALRLFVVAGSAMAALPMSALLIRELYLGNTVPSLLLAGGLLTAALNLWAARWEPYPIWPSRLMIAFCIVIILHGVWLGTDDIRLIWPLVIPPLVLFVYGRVEGIVWTVLLFLPCIGYLAVAPVETGSAVDFVLAYGFSTLTAFTFHSLFSASRRHLAAHEDALEEKQRELFRAQKMEAVGQLTSGLAHDLNNILTVIGGNLDLLKSWERLEPRPHQYVEEALHATQRAAELTSSLLAFARQQPLAPTTCDLGELLSGAPDLLQRVLGERYEVSVELAPQLWPVYADRAQLESALLNLALNARDAMPDGGLLRIRAENEDIASGGTLPAGSYVRLSVTDNGTGIPEEIRDFIFDPFFTTKDVNEGTGLGLSMVFGFAQQSNGDVRIEQSDVKGTTIALYLPRSEQANDSGSQAPLPDGCAEMDRLEVLVLEDNPSVAATTQRMLETLNCRASLAADTQQARRLASSLNIQLLIADMVLSGNESGFVFAQELKRQQPGLPVLLISGYAPSFAGARSDPMTAFLSKPFTIADLSTAIAGLLARAPQAIPQADASLS